MAIRVVRLGQPRLPDEGTRLGTVRRRLIALLAALSRTAAFSIGCYCADGSRCHRALLGELLRGTGAIITQPN